MRREQELPLVVGLLMKAVNQRNKILGRRAKHHVDFLALHHALVHLARHVQLIHGAVQILKEIGPPAGLDVDLRERSGNAEARGRGTTRWRAVMRSVRMDISMAVGLDKARAAQPRKQNERTKVDTANYLGTTV